MIFRFVIYGCVLLLVSSCASTTQHAKPTDVKSTSETQQKKSPIPLQNMDTHFLYLAYQKALYQGQYTLAARFLKALVKKDPDTLELRFELVDLYLSSGHHSQMIEALGLMEGLTSEILKAFKGEALAKYQLLYARTLVANGDVKKAHLVLQDILKTQPKHIEVRLLLVRMYAMKGETKRAHHLLAEGLKISPELRLQEAQVQLFIQEKNWKAAERVLTKMYNLYPDNEDIVLQRSQIAEQQGHVAKAESFLKTYTDKHGKSAVLSFSMLANLYVRQGRLQDAISIFKHLLRLTADTGSVYMSLGKIYYQIGDFGQAVTSFQQAAQRFASEQQKKRISDAQATVYFYLAASLEASRDNKQAIEYYKKLKSYHVFYIEAQLRLASMAIAQRAYTSAEKRLQKLLTLDNKNVNIYEMISNLRLRQKDYVKLITDTEPALSLGFSSSLLLNRAIAFEFLKQFLRLDSALETILQQNPEDAEALNFFGYSLADRGIRLAEALVMVNKALSIKPEDGYYLDSLAWVYFKQGKYSQAVEVQQRAVVAVPGDPVMHEHLGDMYWKENKLEKAKKHWQKALDFKHEEPKKIKEKIKHGLL